MYHSTIADKSMNWRENQQWQTTQNVKETQSPTTLSIRDLPSDIDGTQLENLIVNTPLDLSVFAESKQKRNVESPLDLSCKTRKRCADSTEERQYGYDIFLEPVEKKLCTGLKNPHMLYGATSVLHFDDDGSAVDKRYRQNLNQNVTNIHGNKSVIEGTRQNSLKTGSDIHSQVIKQFSASAGVSGVQQNLRGNYVPVSCQSNSAKSSLQIEKQQIPQNHSHIASIQNGKVTTLRQNSNLGPILIQHGPIHDQRSPMQGQQLSMQAQYDAMRGHHGSVQGKRISMQGQQPSIQIHNGAMFEQVGATQTQNMPNRMSQVNSAIRSDQERTLVQTSNNINSNNDLMSQRQSEVKSHKQNILQQQDRYFAQQRIQGQFSQHQRLSEKDAPFSTQQQKSQYNEKLQQHGNLVQTQSSTLNSQYRRHMSPQLSPSTMIQQNYDANQQHATRTSNMLKMDERKSCIQQPSLQYQNMMYMKQQHLKQQQQQQQQQLQTAKLQQYRAQKASPPISKHQDSMKHMDLAQTSVHRAPSTSAGMYYSHPHQLFTGKQHSVQRCSPDSTNASTHPNRCDKVDCVTSLPCAERTMQYSPAVKRNLSSSYSQNVDSITQSTVANVSSMVSVSGAYPHTFNPMKTSLAGSNMALNSSSLSSATVSKHIMYNDNARAGTRQDSSSSVKNTTSPFHLFQNKSSPSSSYPSSSISHSMLSYNGAQRSIMSGTSGINRSPSVEIIQQHSGSKTANADRSTQQLVLQSNKNVSHSSAIGTDKSRSANLSFANSEYQRSVSAEKVHSERSTPYSQVERKIKSSADLGDNDIMTHLFSQVEKELNEAHKSENLSKDVSGSITDVYKSRKENVKTEGVKTEKVEMSSLNENTSSVKSEIDPKNATKDESKGKEEEIYSSPLSINIPSNASVPDSSRNNVKNEFEHKPIKCLSRKQLILNAVNKDECLKKIVNSVVPKTKQRTLSPSDSLSRIGSQAIHNPSPTFPESPKMPTLSPQQKLPTPVVSPLISEPPTLDPAASTSYRQRLEPKLTLLRKPPSNASTSHENRSSKPPLPIQSTFSNNMDKLQEYAIQGTSAFNKRPSMLHKRIPVANVAPMVHRSISEDAESIAQTDGSLEKSDESNLKSLRDIASSGQLLPSETEIQTYNVSVNPLLDKSKIDGCDLVSPTDSEPFTIFDEKANQNHRMSPLMKKKIFQKTFSSKFDEKDEITKSSQSADDIKAEEESASSRSRQRQRSKMTSLGPSRKLPRRNGSSDDKCLPGSNNCKKGSNKKSNTADTNSKQNKKQSSLRINRKRKAWLSLNNAHHMQLRRSNGADIPAESKNRRSESLRTRKRRTHLRQAASKLCKPVNDRRAKALENDAAGTKNDATGKDKDGMWEVTGSGSTLRNGKPKGGLMLKLFFRKKKKRRFTRKQRKRTNVKINALKVQQSAGYGKAFKARGYPGGLDQQTSQNSQLDSSLFDAEGGEYSYQFESDLPENDPSKILLPPEVKRLAVCRDTGETPLHRAARMGHQDVAAFCLKSGTVEVNAKDNAGYTPLHECSVSGHMGIARLLLSYGANVNGSSQDGIRPIHDAVENDHLEIVRLLMTFGADPTISTYSGRTPAKIARSKKMQLLIKGHLGDLNGFDTDQEESVWDFPSIYQTHDTNLIPETDIFSNIPPDPEVEPDDEIFQEFQKPVFSLFKISGLSSEQSTECVLLRDVADYYHITDAALEKTSGIKSSISVSKEQIISNPLGFLMHERIQSIPGSNCRLLKSQELPKVIDKCESRAERKYPRKNTSAYGVPTTAVTSSCGKKNKDRTKSPASNRSRDHKQTSNLEEANNNSGTVTTVKDRTKSPASNRSRDHKQTSNLEEAKNNSCTVKDRTKSAASTVKVRTKSPASYHSKDPKQTSNLEEANNNSVTVKDHTKSPARDHKQTSNLEELNNNSASISNKIVHKNSPPKRNRKKSTEMHIQEKVKDSKLINENNNDYVKDYSAARERSSSESTLDGLDYASYLDTL